MELRYTTSANITGKPLYPPGTKALGTKRMSLALRQAQDSLNTQGLGIIVFDAYRPKTATRKLWNKAVETNQAIFYAPPWVGSPHNHGAAIDIGLCSLSNPRVPLPMPMAFDETDPKKFNPSPEAKQNDETLTLAMTQAGFAKHPLECWHFSLPPSNKL